MVIFSNVGINVAYKNDDELANELQPRWIKTLRALVFGLIGVSIMAMISLIFAAYHLATKPNLPPLPSALGISSEKILSVTQMPDGGAVVVYDDGALVAESFDASGHSTGKARFQ